MRKWILNAGRIGLGVLLAAGLAASLPAQDRKPIQFDRNQGKAALSDFAEDPVVDTRRDEKIRHNIPVLQAAVVTEERYVDPDALYDRRLSMYESGQTFNTSLPRTTSPDGQAEERAGAGDRRSGEDRGAADSTFKILLVATFLALCFGAYLVSLRKGARTGP
jgi:hypothetical protein